ncbi:hypothetical protein [Aromatoleum tolulyticum]|uniref:hypothetical protein n=1 Tax=Aromatoleum tolulyticum TaxID=34027 RepID=UPI0009704C9E|nr:hypothetical protein [Aromatoleum tolulyticum]
MIRAFLASSEPTDRYATWATVGVAGAIVAVISNLKDSQELIGTPGLRSVLLFLIGALAFGLLQRAAAAYVVLGLSVQSEAEASAREVVAKHAETEAKIQAMAEDAGLEVNTSLDITRPLGAYSDVIPLPFRWIVQRAQKKATADPSYLQRKLVCAVFRQSLYLIFEILFAIAAVVVVVVNL